MARSPRLVPLEKRGCWPEGKLGRPLLFPELGNRVGAGSCVPARGPVSCRRSLPGVSV